MAYLLNLVDRLRKANGPDRELDVAIMQALIPECEMYSPMCRGDEPIFWHGPYRKQECPRLTESLDAVVALIERQLPGMGYWLMCPGNGDKYGHVQYNDRGADVSARGASAPIAILAAFLLALQEKEKTRD